VAIDRVSGDPVDGCRLKVTFETEIRKARPLSTSPVTRDADGYLKVSKVPYIK
jgi:hypothetical protein